MPLLAPSGSSTQSLSPSGVPAASFPAASARLLGPLTAEAENAQKDPATGTPPARPPSGDEEEDGLNVEFVGVSAVAPFQRPNRGVPKKRPVSERGRGRKGAATRGRKNSAVTFINESDSQDEAVCCWQFCAAINFLHLLFYT